MSEHPSGWYPDPRGRHEYRFWDGSTWTDHVADDGQASTDPVDAAPAVPARETDPEPAVVSGSGAHSGADAGGDANAGAGAHSGPAAGGDADAGEAGRGAETATAAETAASSGAGASAAGDASTEPNVGDQAREALRSATATKSPGLAGLLTVVFPGSGHFYLGAGDKVPLAVGLLVVTLVAYAIAWISFGAFVVGFALWAAAAAFGVFDLQSVLKPIREAGAAAASVSAQQVGLVLIAGGVLLVVALLLPWYHVAIDSVVRIGPFQSSGEGFSRTQNAFEALDVICWLLLVVGAGALVLGATAMGIGPLRDQRLPSWLPPTVAVVGVVGLVLVAIRLAFGVTNLPDAPGLDYDVGRGPGILLAGAATLGIAAAGTVTFIQARRPGGASVAA